MAKFIRFHNIRLRYKMFFPLALSLIALLLVSITSISYSKSLMGFLVTNLYDEFYKSSYWLFNADRDFYQALVAQNNLENAVTQEEKMPRKILTMKMFHRHLSGLAMQEPLSSTISPNLRAIFTLPPGCRCPNCSIFLIKTSDCGGNSLTR